MGHLTVSEFLVNQFSRFPPLEARDLSGKTVVVVGGNAGLGFEACRHLASMRPGKLILACRNLKKGEDAAKAIRESTGFQDVVVRIVDVASYSSVVDFCKTIEREESRLDVCMYNAGIIATKFKATADGNEESLQVNFLSCALLSILLYPLLSRTASLDPEGPRPRLVLVTSDTHFWIEPTEEELSSPTLLEKLNDAQYSSQMRVIHNRYFLTKLLQVLFLRELAARVTDNSVIVNGVNPGLCRSNLASNVPFPLSLIFKVQGFLLARTTEMGGRLLTWAAVGAPHREKEMHGHYISDMQVKEESDFALSLKGYEVGKRVWNETIEALSNISPDVKVILASHLSP